MTGDIFFGWYIFIFILHANRFDLQCMFKKNHDPSCLINQKSSDPPLSITNFFMAFTFLPPPPPLEINNDRSLSDPRKIGLSIFNLDFSHCGFYVLGNNHLLIWGAEIFLKKIFQWPSWPKNNLDFAL